MRRFFSRNSFLIPVYALTITVGTYYCISIGIEFIFDYQDQQFAAKYFYFMPHHETLESRKWNKDSFDCTYAIVSLPGDAPTAPPGQWIESSYWHGTPLEFEHGAENGHCRNIVCKCRDDWAPANYRTLERALSQPGSFYAVLGRAPPLEEIHQGVIFIYSHAEKVAAMVRYGD